MTSQQVIRSYRAIAGLYTLSASLIWGVNTLFLLEAGLGVLRALGEPADVLIGSAGHKGSCAAQGLPSVATVDSISRQY